MEVPNAGALALVPIVRGWHYWITYEDPEDDMNQI